MMALIGAIILVLGFLFFLKIFDLVEKSVKVINMAKASVEIIRNHSMDDYQKEIAMQKYAVQLLSLFFQITACSIAAIVIPFGFVWLMDFANMLTVDEVVAVTLSLEFIVGTVVISVAYFYVVRRK